MLRRPFPWGRLPLAVASLGAILGTAVACDLMNDTPVGPGEALEAPGRALLDHVGGQSHDDVLYSVDADFAHGALVNVNFNAPNGDQLQLNEGQAGSAAFPFVNVAASQRGTAVRSHTETGVITGEYLTAPNGRGRNPSRTTVDLQGNVWVGNRNETGTVGGVSTGSVVRIGLITGGTRTDAGGTPDPNGQYLAGPFEYNTCVDRDGDGLIRTSRGLGNILPWTNDGGADNLGGVSTAQDECIINYTRAGGGETRTVAVDANNDVWVAGTSTRRHEKIDGVTGVPVPGSSFTPACGSYGGFIDRDGILWSMSSFVNFGAFLRYDTNTGIGACIPLSDNYGTGLDPNTGEVWVTTLSQSSVHKFAPDGTLLGSFTHGHTNAQGVVVDNNGSVWVAHSLFGATTVGHLKTDGTYVGNVALPGGSGPTGVAVDADGKVWVANINSNNAMRIDPAAGPMGADGVTPVGAVDLTVALGSGAGPYNYSDMTGFVVGGIAPPMQGTWTIIQDAEQADFPWGKITWNTESEGAEPEGTEIIVEARVADVEAGLSGETYQAVSNGGLFSLDGRYIQVRVTLRTNEAGLTPVLSDIRIEGGTRVTDPVDPEDTLGCSAGYWGQPGIRFGTWPAGYDPGDPVSSLFAGASGYLGETTLEAALEGFRDSTARRSSLDGSREILIRQAVAAVLNEASFGADFPAPGIGGLTDVVNAALGSDDRQGILALADLLDAWNNNFEVDGEGNVVLDEHGDPVLRGTCPL